jgi:nucleoside-diphosphate-sugar epimerase
MTRGAARSARRTGKPASAGGGTAFGRALGGGTLLLQEGLAMAKSWHFFSHTARDQPVEVVEVVELIKRAMGKPARCGSSSRCNPGDVPETCADTTDLERAVGFRPQTPIGEGGGRFVD